MLVRRVDLETPYGGKVVKYVGGFNLCQQTMAVNEAVRQVAKDTGFPSHKIRVTGCTTLVEQ